jgi:hypothetical protein
MKYITLILFLAITSMASATSYYISPSGNDSNNGTISSPFFSLNKAWSAARAGDIIYARGGVYRFPSRQNLTGKNGTATDTIKIWAYPGERPVFTRSSSFTTPSWPVCLIYVKANYIHIRGIEVTQFTQKTSTIWYGIAVLGSNHNKFERISSHHNGHGMVIRDESSHNLVLNCDFHHNYDPISSSPYGDGDGLEIGYHSSSVENTVRGCRMWRNADDGLDLWQNNGNLILENCWAWHNGYREDGRTVGGDGGGFKFGSTTTSNGSVFKRTIKNNIAVYNRTRGYNQNAANVKFYFYNNIAWKNAKGFDFASYNLQHIFRNNIVFGNDNNYSGSYSNSIKDHNTYDPVMSPSGPTASSSDFITLDTTGISKPRKANGSLPDINFMKLAAGSDLIDAGVNVGIAFAGKAPDLGPFETGLQVIAEPPVASTAPETPVFVSATVNDASPDKIEVTYNLKLAPVLPPAASFTAMRNGEKLQVTSITVKDFAVILTLPVAAEKNDTITIAYNQPASNPLQTILGAKAASLSAQLVTNNCLGVKTGSESVVNEGKILIFPNPAKEFIRIANLTPNDVTPILRLFDFSGKLCKEIKLESLALAGKIPIDLRPGLFIAQIIIGSRVHYVQKLIVVN